MIFVILSEAAKKGDLLLVDGGLCHFHRGGDGVVVIAEIIVLPEKRREGIGRKMIESLRKRFPYSPMKAKCPTPYKEGNAFWKGMGFILKGTKDKLNIWELPPLTPSQDGNFGPYIPPKISRVTF